MHAEVMQKLGITDLEKDEGAAAMLKACWLVYPCSSIPTLFLLFSVCVCLLRLAPRLRPSLSLLVLASVFSSFPLLCSTFPISQ